MEFEPRFESIISNVLNGHGPNKDECVYLLGFEPHSLESTYMMSIANDMYRKRMDNSGIIYAQIGVYPGFSKQNGYKLQLQSREIFRARMGT